MDELRALSMSESQAETFYQNIRMKISCLVVSFPWRQDAYTKLQKAFGDGRERRTRDKDVRGGTSYLSSNLVK